MTTSIQQLTGAKNKFQESGECIKRQTKEADNAPVLVPLTGSMYVPGTILNKNKFLVDIGTGYYVEKDAEGATDFFNRKIAFVSAKIDEYIKLVQEKIFLRENLMEVIQVKQQQMIAAASGSSPAAPSAAPAVTPSASGASS